jgi:hypothetical protein
MKPARIISASLGAALLAAAGFGLYVAAARSARLLSAFDLRFAVVALIASLVVLLAATIVAASVRRLGRSGGEAAHAEKAATYQLFVDLWGPLLQPGGAAEVGSPYPWPAERQALTRLTALYGSPGVVRAYAAFSASAGESVADSQQARAHFAGTLLEMRRDLGSETRGLTAEELQRVFFADPEGGCAPAPASGYQISLSLAPGS